MKKITNRIRRENQPDIEVRILNEFISICRGITSIVEMVLYNRINRFVRKEVLLQGDHKGVFDIIMESVSFVVYFIGFIYMEIRFSLVQPYMNAGRS